MQTTTVTAIAVTILIGTNFAWYNQYTKLERIAAREVRTAQVQQACFGYATGAGVAAALLRDGNKPAEVKRHMVESFSSGREPQIAVLAGHAADYAIANYKTSKGLISEEYFPVCVALINARY